MQYSVDADAPVVIAEGVAESVGDIRIQLGGPTLAKSVSIEVAVQARLLDESTEPRRVSSSALALLPDGSSVAGKYTSSHTIRFDGLDGSSVGTGPVVISGLRIVAASLGLPSSKNSIEVRASIRLLPDLESKVTYFSDSADVLVARSMLALTSTIIGVADDSFVSGRATLLTRFAPLPSQRRLKAKESDLFLVGAARLCEPNGGLFRLKSPGEDSGTRFILHIEGIPSGVDFLVSVTDVDIAGLPGTPSLILVEQASSSGAGGRIVEAGRAPGTTTTLRDVKFHQVNGDDHSNAKATFEFVGERSKEGSDSREFDVVMAIRGQPGDVGVCTVTVSLGPLNRYSEGELPIPRYVDASPAPEELVSTARESSRHWLRQFLESVNSEHVDWPTLLDQWKWELYWPYEGTGWEPPIRKLGAAIQAKDVRSTREALEELASDPPD